MTDENPSVVQWIDWGRIVLIAVTAAAVWCARLEFKTSDNRTDTDELSKRVSGDHDQAIRLTQCARDHGWNVPDVWK